MSGKIRQRMMVTIGDLMQLHFEVEQVRNAEKKAQFKASFKQLLHDAELVKMQVVTKKRKEVSNG